MMDSNQLSKPTVPYLLHCHAKRYKHRDALIYEDRRWKWDQLYEEAMLVANALLSRGLRSGDRVAILSGNCPEFWQLFLGCSLSGIVLCPINFRSVPEFETVRDLLADSGSRLVFVEEKYADFMCKVAAYTGIGEERVIVIDRDFYPFVRTATSHGVSFDIHPDSPLMMLHTSGTTSRPKWAMITNSAYVWNGVVESHHIGVRYTDRVLQAMPFVHTGGICWMTSGTFVSGATLVLVKKWEPEMILSTIQKEKCTKMWGQEAGLNRLIRYPDVRHYDLTSLQSVFTAAGLNKRDWSAEVVYTLGLSQFQYAYGSTEAGLVSITNSLTETLYKEGSVGQPVFSCEVKIVGLDGQASKTGEIGELWVRSPAVFAGYHNHPEKSERVFEEGWYHTGDMVREDEEGCLYFINRNDDMIKTGGENVSPFEIEQALLRTNPEVSEAVVVGIDDEKWTQAVTAFVVCRTDIVNENIIRDRMRGSIADFKIPKAVHFINQIPKSDQGKILRTELRRVPVVQPPLNEHNQNTTN